MSIIYARDPIYGPPIDKLSKGEGTFKVFGVDGAKGYLDKYAITESIIHN